MSHHHYPSCDPCEPRPGDCPETPVNPIDNLKECYPCLNYLGPWGLIGNITCVEKDHCPRGSRCGGYNCGDCKEKKLCVRTPGDLTVRLTAYRAMKGALKANPKAKKHLKKIWKYICEYLTCVELTLSVNYFYSVAVPVVFAEIFFAYAGAAAEENPEKAREAILMNFLDDLRFSIKRTFCDTDDKCYKHVVCCWKELRAKFRRFAKYHLRKEEKSDSSMSSSSSSSSGHCRKGKRSGCRKRYHRPFFSSSSNDSSSYCAWD